MISSPPFPEGELHREPLQGSFANHATITQGSDAYIATLGFGGYALRAMLHTWLSYRKPSDIPVMMRIGLITLLWIHGLNICHHTV
jgi:hypothetical protein